jgi:hypothetical protein
LVHHLPCQGLPERDVTEEEEGLGSVCQALLAAPPQD